MKKSFLFSAIIIAILLLAFSFNSVYANTGNIMTFGNGIKDAVGGAENAVENVVKDVGNTISGKTTENNSTQNTGNTDNSNNAATTNNNNNNSMIMGGSTSGYGTTRTSTNGADATFLGMNGTAWTWFVIAVLAVLIVAVVWFYGRQFSKSKDSDQ